MEEAISIKTAEAFESQVPCTYSALADYIFEAFNLTVSNQFIRLTVKRSSQVKTILSHPMEADRVACPESDINVHFELLGQELEQMPACLICNLDEIGWGKYQDAQSITLVVPSHCPDRLPYLVDRTRRRLTILHCLFVDGSYVIPLVLFSRQTIDAQVFNMGCTLDKVILRYQESAFITQDLFIES
jgi:hypothetical protein